MSADSSIMAAAIARNRRMVKSSTKAREQRVHYIIIAIGWLLAVMVSSKHTAKEKWRPTMNHTRGRKLAGEDRSNGGS
jgi:hypothetical protein